MGLWALLSSLLAGASVICTPGFDGEQFFRWLEAFGRHGTRRFRRFITL
jgi:hypothetical protein